MFVKKIALTAAAFLAFGVFSACKSAALSPAYTPGSNAPAIVAAKHAPVSLDCWAADWDIMRGKEEWQRNENKLDSLCYFAAAFDADNHLIISPQLGLFRQEMKKSASKSQHFLTIVNDVTDKNGRQSEKSIDVVATVLKDAAAQKKHIAEIIKLAKGGGYNGIEIDYERIHKDAALLPKFIDFIAALYAATQENGFDMRVVLEPSAPFDAAWPNGPLYVVMLYNLYGTHSGPGPKADGPFIDATIAKMAALPERKGVAFSTGGCLWQDAKFFLVGGGKPRFIDESEARQLLKKSGAAQTRDAASGALSFSYDEGISRYTVWYADYETINAWITRAANHGINSVSLWRLGGFTSVGKVKK